MFSEKSKTVLRVFVSFFLILIGSAYLLYLQVIFPKLVPSYGGGEKFRLSEANNFTFQIPWSACSRLHLTLQANGTLELYRDGDYICDCSSYEFVIEAGDEAHILLKSNSSVSGMFEVSQEIPLEKQILAFIIILAGLIGIALSIRTHNYGAITGVYG